MGGELVYCINFCISSVLQCGKYFEKKIEWGKEDEKIQVEKFTILNKVVSMAFTEKWHMSQELKEVRKRAKNPIGERMFQAMW